MAASRTAQFIALYRAFETCERRRPPLFRDPYAVGFLSRRLALVVRASRVPVVRGWVERYADHRSPGSRTSAIARTAYIDDAVRAAVAGGTGQTGRAERTGPIDQLVILGAGFDCRARTFGLHPGDAGAFAARSGLRLCEDVGADDYRRRYLGAAAMPGYQFYRIALAEVAPRAPAG
jgi:hypothetical protein